MKAALMAAGESTRMKPLSVNMPKHLLPVAGKPLIFHTLERLRDAGIKESLVITGYHEDMLREAINANDWSPMTVSYITQDERKGTAHAATFAKEFAGDSNLLLMNGDIMTGPGTFEGLIKQHESKSLDLTLSVITIEDPTAYGIVVVKDEKATGLIEKPTKDQLQFSNLVNAGIYALGPSLWDAIDKTKPSSRGEYEITDSIRMLIDKGTVGAFTIPSWWLDVGKPWDLLNANKFILDSTETRIEGTVEEGAVIKGTAIVESNATVRSGAYIEGPIYIGEESIVGPNCYIRAHTTLCKKVKIGNAVEIKNSIIMDYTNVGHLSYVGDSIIGQRSNFGAGTITATTLTILNIIMYSTLILIGMAGEKYYINYLMLLANGLDFACFVRFYSVKVNLDQMDLIEKFDYFSIVVIRGLGIGLLFNIISWIIPPDLNIIMII